MNFWNLITAPFRRKRVVVRVFGGFIDALKAKDAELYAELCHLPTAVFWREWKKVHPEDFPLGGMSPASASSIVPR